MLQSPSGDRGESSSTVSTLSLQFNQQKGMLHVAYCTPLPLTTQQRPLSTATGAAQAACDTGTVLQACD